jgi:hypothetical protein
MSRTITLPRRFLDRRSSDFRPAQRELGIAVCGKRPQKFNVPIRVRKRAILYGVRDQLVQVQRDRCAGVPARLPSTVSTPG